MPRNPVNATDTQTQKTHRDHEWKNVLCLSLYLHLVPVELQLEMELEMEMELLMPDTCKCILVGHSNDHHDDNDHNDAAFDDRTQANDSEKKV
ncbi:uncharacterized protein Dsimw501_GD27065 [Drosophila simulans]|uniref:Uncharacterized protein n=1 Tax=Drosophila simulans TaxID=7240 RepID=A0A0J9RSU6_DROSI|nr:uncharacterized protein Dsimw501_GD27065 [Drosophila simulans]